MRNAKKLLLLLLALALSLAMFACGDGEDGGDGGDENPPAVANNVELITDGIANFRIVLGKKIPTTVRKAVDFEILPALEEQDITVISAQQGTANDKVEEIEVLIGDVTNRGEEYIFDRYDFGKKGYMIKIVGTKIVIQAGSDEALYDAVMEFAEDVLGINSESMDNVTMLAGLKSDKENKGNEVYYIQDDYDVESLSVGSADMKGYTIAVDSANKYHKAVALNMQETFYDETGYFFKIVSPEDASDKSIILQHIDKKTVSGEDTFTIKVEGTKLVIRCAYDNKLEECVNEFMSEYVIWGDGDVSFSGKIAEEDISVVYYEDFGAVADDNKNDYQAFYDAHVFANQSGQTVKARTDGPFLLGHPTVELKGGSEIITSIPIKTNVDWTGVEIIIDDTDLDLFDATLKDMAQTWAFSIEHDEDATVWRADQYKDKLAKLTESGSVGYKNGTKKLDLGLGYSALLIIYNEKHEVYRRYGSLYDGSGHPQHEIIVIDKDGNIDESTPFMFDYDEITKIEIYNIDIEPITIKGGTVTTLAPQFDAREYGTDGKITKDSYYFARGLYINRSFTTIDGLEHYVENEITLDQYFNDKIQGAAYDGFYNATGANEVTIKNCVMTGRRNYATHGTYEFSADCVNKITLESCYQHNFWIDENYNPSDEYTGITSMDTVSADRVGENGTQGIQYCWGLGQSDYCKNMSYIDSRLSRFDAHCGLYNGMIDGCEINGLEIIGKGTFILKDTDYYSYGSRNLVSLRGDYGHTWEGNFLIENVRWYADTANRVNIFYHKHVNWDFGYKCHIPAVEIKDIYLYNSSTYNEADGEFTLVSSDYQKLYMYSEITDRYMHLDQTYAGANNDNPIGVPEYVKISSNVNGYQFNIPYDSDPDAFLAGVEFISGTDTVEYNSGIQGWFNFQ